MHLNDAISQILTYIGAFILVIIALAAFSGFDDGPDIMC